MAYIAKITDLEGSTYDLRSKTTSGILYGAVDSTSTSTAFTVTVPGVTEYYDGLTILLRNGVVTSASNFTINVNGLGGKPSYNNMTTGNPITPTNPTRDTTIFNINYTMLITYSSTLVSGGAWIMYRGYDANTNTIGYQLRSNSYVLNVSDRTRYYRLLFTSADGTQWVPANTEYDNSATSKKTVNQRKINPFGEIVYLANSTNYAANAAMSATAIWQQYTFSLGYSFNRTGAALTLTTKKPVYVKCAPQSDGSAIIDSTEPIVQTLPSTEDGKIYILLGMAYSATNIELLMNHPIYYYKDGCIRLWTNAVTGGSVDSVNGQTGTVVLDADDVGALPDTTIIPSKTSDLTNDSGYITGISSSDVTTALGYTPYNATNPSGYISGISSSDVTTALGYTPYNSTNPNSYVDATGAANAAPVQSVNGQTGTVSLSIPTKTSDLTNDSGFITGMYIGSYGSSTYAEVLAAYQAKKVVYCRASSNTNPASGSQNRMAFLAYVNDSTTPTEFEFQYYRSVSTHSNTQQGDQVFIYKLNSSTGWSVTTREAYTKVVAGTNMTSSYSSGAITLNASAQLPSVTSSDNGKVLMVVNGAWAAATIPSASGVSF